MTAEEVIAQKVWQAYVVEVGRALPEGLADKMAAVVVPGLETEGYAVVELPPKWDDNFYYSEREFVYAADGEVQGRHGTEFGEPDRVRAFAAALLAAADAAEAAQ